MLIEVIVIKNVQIAELVHFIRQKSNRNVHRLVNYKSNTNYSFNNK